MIIPIEYNYHGYKNSYIRLDISPSNAIAIYSERCELIKEVKDGYSLEKVLKFLREGIMSVKIYSPSGRLMNSEEIAKFANHVHQMFAKGSPYTKGMYEEHEGEDYRLSGCHCDCGYEYDLPGRPTKGEFQLLPPSSKEVQDGQKVYMVCRKCGGYSHL